MQLHETGRTGLAGAQIMHPVYTFDVTAEGHYSRLFLGWQLTIEQRLHRFIADAAPPQQEQPDQDGKQAVGPVPALPRQHQCQQHAAVEQQVGAVVQHVGLDGHAVGLADHQALETDQQQGQHDGATTDPQTRLEPLQRRLLEQRGDAVHHQQQGGTGDKGRLDQPGQRLRLAVAEAVFVVGR